MMRIVRKHMRDFLAIVFLGLTAAGVAGYILSQQRFYPPDWVPVVGQDFYVIKAEFQTAQAVVPGQGQTVNIAGVKVGDIGKVELDDGIAVVELKIKQKYAPVYRDAKLLLRPKTGLKDMYVQMNPGTQAAGELPEGGRIPVRSTIPDVNPDEVLSALDADTRAYLQILLNAGGQAFTDKEETGEQAESTTDPAATGAGGSGSDADSYKQTQSNSADLRETFKRFEPTNRDVARFTRELVKRRSNLKRVIHNYRLLIEELGRKDSQLASFVDSSNANFQAFADQEVNIREALRLFPSTLETTRNTLGKADRLAQELGPSFEALRPFARALGPALRDTRPFLRETTPIIEKQLRPFARDVRPSIRELRRAAEDLAPATARFIPVVDVLNSLLNTLTYNPAGSEEGFLFWASWAGHDGSLIFNTQDAHGAVRRGLFLADCGTLTVIELTTPSVPQLKVLTDLLGAPTAAEICPQAPTPTKKRRQLEQPEAGPGAETGGEGEGEAAPERPDVTPAPEAEAGLPDAGLDGAGGSGLVDPLVPQNRAEGR